MVGAGAWVPVAQSLHLGKLRNDTSSLPLTLVLPSLPLLLLSFTKQPEIKPIPRAFISFFICTS